MDEDWVFASPTMKGKQPYWPDNLMKRYIKPVARKAGITRNIGWHSLVYVRHGTTTLFAALDIATGTVLTECKPRHRHQEFLSFIERIDQAVPAALDVHLIVDNYSTHKHAKVRLWLAARPRFHVHYTPHLFFLAQSGRTMVRAYHPTGHPPRLLQKRQRSHRKDRPLH